MNAAAAADALAVAAAVPDGVAPVLAEAGLAEAAGAELPLADPAEFPQPARPGDHGGADRGARHTAPGRSLPDRIPSPLLPHPVTPWSPRYLVFEGTLAGRRARFP